ncbi:hypothetical protein OH77DRAFT_1422942 [Trametes cingulata]|nr:hypothetical protein OH77DRAFT_1422942 [Trametes cingulata]
MKLVARQAAFDGSKAEALIVGIGFSVLAVLLLVIGDQCFGGRALKAVGRVIRFMLAPRKFATGRPGGTRPTSSDEPTEPTISDEGHVITIETREHGYTHDRQLEVVAHPRSTLHRAPGRSVPAAYSGIVNQSPADVPCAPHTNIEEVAGTLDPPMHVPQPEAPLPQGRVRVVNAPPSAFIRPSRLRSRAPNAPPSAGSHTAQQTSSLRMTGTGDLDASYNSSGVPPSGLVDEPQDSNHSARNSASGSIREGSIMSADDDYLSMVTVSTVPPSYTTVSTVPPSYHTGRVLVARPVRSESSRPRPLPPVPQTPASVPLSGEVEQ